MRVIHPSRCGVLACTAVALILLSSALPVRAASDRDEVARLQIGHLTAEGRCDDALHLIDRERAEAPGDAALALLQGQCRIRLFDYLGAVESLNEAKAISPELQRRNPREWRPFGFPESTAVASRYRLAARSTSPLHS